ncbi:MAG: S-layer y domain protein [Firmicutes bacterium]|nr:S-layer y domain protein [Bacillota bacterium]
MKKGTIAIIMIAVFCFASVATAATTPFSDVPSTHWAYGAVNKLAKAGIIDGMGKGGFQGDKTLTRYEMAQIVANAMTKSDEADAENKAIIDRLSQEFATELQALGIRVAALEQNQSPLKISGFAQYRYEYAENPRTLTTNGLASQYGVASDKTQSRTALNLFLDNKFDGNTYAHVWLNQENLDGQINDSNDIEANVHVQEAYFANKMGNIEVAVGKFLPDSGLGTLSGAPFMGGGRLAFNIGNEKVRVWSTKFGGMTFNQGDVTIPFSKNGKIIASYFGDKGKNLYDATLAGFVYNITPDIKLDGEYGQNKAATAKLADNGNTPKAAYLRAKYKGANPFQVGSYGVAVQYRKANDGFDIMSMAAPYAWNAPYNWSSPAGGGVANNMRGVELSVETTIAPRLIFSAAYGAMKADVTSSFGMTAGITPGVAKDNQKYLTAQLFYLF